MCLFKVRLLIDELSRNIHVMAEDQPGIKESLKSTDHVEAAIPCIMISRQPSMGMTKLIVLRNVKLVRSPDEWPIICEVDLHDTQSRRMSR